MRIFQVFRHAREKSGDPNAQKLHITRFGLVKILIGVLLLWGEYEYQPAGSLYGFLWPRTMDIFFKDVRVLNLLAGAIWLIRSGLWGPSINATSLERGTLIHYFFRPKNDYSRSEPDDLPHREGH